MHKNVTFLFPALHWLNGVVVYETEDELTGDWFWIKTQISIFIIFSGNIHSMQSQLFGVYECVTCEHIISKFIFFFFFFTSYTNNMNQANLLFT